MEWFLTRVELHDADREDYERLHQEMERRKFVRAIPSDEGVMYKLPTAEYFSKSSTLNVEQVRGLAREAADATGKAFWIITVRFDCGAWYLEPK